MAFPNKVIMGIKNPAPSILNELQRINKQVNLVASNLTGEFQLGTLVSARRNSKLFVIGFIAPDIPVNFIPIQKEFREVKPPKPIKKKDLGQPDQPLTYTAEEVIALAAKEIPVLREKQKTNPNPTPEFLGPPNKHASELSDAFYEDLIKVCANTNITDPANALMVMYSESYLQSGLINPFAPAKGIFQLLSPHSAGMPAQTHSVMQYMNAEQQLPFYQNYIKKIGQGKPMSAMQLYLINAGKGYLAGVDEVSDQTAATWSIFTGAGAAHNPGMDKWPKDGKITLWEFRTQLRIVASQKDYQDAVARLREVEAALAAKTDAGSTELEDQNIVPGPNQVGVMAYGGVTDEESDDPAVPRLGKNIRAANEERQKAVRKQTEALKRQIEAIERTPPLIMLVNPRTFTRNYEQAVDSGVKGRFGNIVHTWLERPIKIDSEGASAGQYVINAAGAGGLTTERRVHTLSYTNLMSLVSMYKNNGVIFTGDEAGAERGIPMGQFTVYIYYDNHIYLGSFDDFSVKDTADKPFTMDYSFKFNVRYDLDIDSSHLVEARIFDRLRF